MTDHRNSGGYKASVMGASTNAAGGSSVMGASTAPTTNVMGAYSAPTNVMGAFSAPTTNVMGAYAPAAAAPQFGPTTSFPTQTAPAQVSPTQQFVKTNVINTVVPHVHPSHTTTVNKHVYTHQHYFPHTQSVVNECYNQQVVCCPPPVNPCCPPRPFGFGF